MWMKKLIGYTDRDLDKVGPVLFVVLLLSMGSVLGVLLERTFIQPHKEWHFTQEKEWHQSKCGAPEIVFDKITSKCLDEDALNAALNAVWDDGPRDTVDHYLHLALFFPRTTYEISYYLMLGALFPSLLETSFDKK